MRPEATHNPGAQRPEPVEDLRLNEPSVETPAGRARALPPPRRDAAALGFGAAFLALGALGLLRAAGAPLPGAWLYAAALVGLGVAGLVSTLSRQP